MDGWESFKTHITGIILQGDNVWVTFDDNGNVNTSDVHHGIMVAQEMEEIMNRVQNAHPDLRFRAICTDDAGQYGRARRILALRHPHWHFGKCFAHQVNLIVKMVLKIGYADVIAITAEIVNKFNKSSSKWLVRLNEASKLIYGKCPALQTLLEVRWNSAQSCLASVLRIKSAFRCVHLEYATDDSSQFPTVFNNLGDSEFWKNVEDAEHVIRPLAEASFILQRNQTKLSDGLLVWGKIYRTLRTARQHGSKFAECMEKRFKKEEHPLFLLAFMLDHRYYRTFKEICTSSNCSMLNSRFMCSTAVYYFKKFIADDSGNIKKLYNQTAAYFKGANIDPLMMQNVDSVFDYWEMQGASMAELSTLALFILSIVIQSANCERLFSNFGFFRTDLRNRLKPDKLHKLQEVKRRVYELDQAQEHKRGKIVSSKELSKMNQIPTPALLRAVNFSRDCDEPENAAEIEAFLAGIGSDNMNFNNVLSDWLLKLDEANAEDVDERDSSLPEDESEHDVALEAQNMKYDDGSTYRASNPWPSDNDIHYPQEVLKGFRSKKVTLKTLFDNFVDLPNTL